MAKLRNIVNYRDTKNGYFYLHPESTISLKDASVIDLRTILSLRSTLHYDQLLKSRVSSINEEYSNKLGWMLGNMFSRVPLYEWDELSMDVSENEVIEGLLQSIAADGNPRLPHEKPDN
mgnify:CR=1 FL=1